MGLRRKPNTFRRRTIHMSKELQILQLTADGKSQRMIAKMLRVSRNTISSVQTAATRSGKAMSELLRMEEPQLIKVLFLKRNSSLSRLNRTLNGSTKSCSRMISLFNLCGKNTVISAERQRSLHTCTLSSASCIQTMSISTD